jgi:hypothetical protein
LYRRSREITGIYLENISILDSVMRSARISILLREELLRRFGIGKLPNSRVRTLTIQSIQSKGRVEILFHIVLGNTDGPSRSKDKDIPGKRPEYGGK